MPKYAARLRGLPGIKVSHVAAKALDLGFEALALARPFSMRHWHEVRHVVPRETLCAVDLFHPGADSLRPDEPCPFELGSLHDEGRRDAIKYGSSTVIFADQNAVPFILVPPFPLESALRRDVDELPRNKRFAERVQKIQVRRATEAKLRLDSFRSVLSRLCDVADRYSPKLALVPGGFIDEAPNIDECAACLKEFAGAPLCLWIDTFSYSMSLELGPVDLTGLLESVAGATLRDFSSKKEPLLAGTGEADWKNLKPLLERSPIWVVDPPRCEVKALERSFGFLEELTSRPEVQVKPGFYLS